MKKSSSLKRRTFALVLAVITALPIFSLTSCGDGAKPKRPPLMGAEANGIIPADGSSDLDIIGINVDFTVNEFPKDSYTTLSELREYGASVKTTYVISNHREETVTESLLLPFGAYPQYVDGDFGNNPRDPSQYTVTVDGKTPALTKRYSYYPPNNSDFWLYEKPHEGIRDSFASNSFCGPDTTVTRYRYGVADTNKRYEAQITVGDDDTERVLIADHDDWVQYNEGRVISIDLDPANGRSEFTVWCVGKPLDDTVNLEFFDTEGKKETEGVLISQETVTFREFATRNRADDSAVSEIDYYNAVFDAVNEYREAEDTPVMTETEYLGIQDDMVTWYRFDITLRAGKTASVSVSAPVYPDIRSEYTDAVYTYRYSTFGIECFNAVGSVHFAVFTEYELLDDRNTAALKKSGRGYISSMYSLPVNNYVEFSLSSASSPERVERGINSKPDNTAELLNVGVVLLVTLPIIPAVAITVISEKKRNKRGK